MSLSSRIHDLTSATGGVGPMAAKLRRAVRTARTMLDATEREARIHRLQAAGLVGERPTDWQLLLGAYHMMFGYILPSNEEFYEHYDVGHWWHQLLRLLEEPATMMDPIGFGLEQQTLVTHMVEVVHSSAGYDVALLFMWEDGLAPLRAELQQVVAGTHPRQTRVDALLENPAYPQALLDALDRYEADPERHWRVSTVPAPAGCDTLFDWGIDTFGSPGRLFAYSRTLPPTPWASLRAWVQGELPLPAPPAVA
jgi:hypothetical protein